jgi:hypothetical protein
LLRLLLGDRLLVSALELLALGDVLRDGLFHLALGAHEDLAELGDFAIGGLALCGEVLLVLLGGVLEGSAGFGGGACDVVDRALLVGGEAGELVGVLLCEAGLCGLLLLDDVGLAALVQRHQLVELALGAVELDAMVRDGLVELGLELGERGRVGDRVVLARRRQLALARGHRSGVLVRLVRELGRVGVGLVREGLLVCGVRGVDLRVCVGELRLEVALRRCELALVFGLRVREERFVFAADARELLLEVTLRARRAAFELTAQRDDRGLVLGTERGDVGFALGFELCDRLFGFAADFAPRRLDGGCDRAGVMHLELAAQLAECGLVACLQLLPQRLQLALMTRDELLAIDTQLALGIGRARRTHRALVREILLELRACPV